ncbi:MAG: hypothetical protein WCK74_04485 [Gemmatimonadaceae bacterium]
MPMDWFESLMGFREKGYAATQNLLKVHGDRLRSTVNGAEYGIGTLELVSLAELRTRAGVGAGIPRFGRLRAEIMRTDARAVHVDERHAGAVMQVASQFNLLEMVGPTITPEAGVTVYQSDPTQGPACAIAAGAATVYRNYFAPVDGAIGQTANRQLDGLADLGTAFGVALDMPVEDLWQMRNGYAMGSVRGITAIGRYLENATEPERDRLRGLLRIGVHADVEVTAAPGPKRHTVTQAFCSALPVAYARNVDAKTWKPFATLVLEAAYEATLCAAVVNAQRTKSPLVFLTSLGGGAFGNDAAWILAAKRRALDLLATHNLDIRFVSFGAPSAALSELVARYS